MKKFVFPLKRPFLFFLFFLLFSTIVVVPAPRAQEKRGLVLLLMPLDSPSVMYGRFLPFKRYLEGRLGIPVKLKVAKKRSEVIETLEKGQADLAFLCPTLYCLASRRIPIVPLAKLRVNGSSQYRSVLLVRNDSGIKKISDLAGRTFVYGRFYCPGSGLLPDMILRGAGVHESDLMDTVRLGSDESAVLAVMARLFDATGVSEITARPYLGKGLRILGYSRPIPQYLFAARGGMDRNLLRRIKAAMLFVNSLKSRKDVLGGIEPGADGLADAHDRDYDIVRKLIREDPDRPGMFRP